jgi:cell fate regulator YaaT (PSP1 superfamily)
MGICGRPLCCNTFLREFEPVTLKMAKEQCLALNPAKISGSCGRLMCCLTYECAAYQQASRQAPGLGSCWTIDGQAVTVRVRDVGNNRVFVENGNEQLAAVDLGVFTGGRATPARIEAAPGEAHEEAPENGDPESAGGTAAADPPGPR